MKKIKNISFIIIGLIITFIISCESNTKSGKSNIEALFSQQLPCHSINGEQQQQMDNESIINHNFEDGILELIVNFKNTCGSAYEDDVELKNNEINIFLNDTASVHYRCICNHQSFHLFELDECNEINVKLYVNAYAHDDYSLICDTTLTL